MANLSNVINVALLPEGASVARDNMNVVCIMTSDTGFLKTSKRFALYSDAASVANDFGSSSDASQFANVFFAQSPNSINAGGVLVIGHWRAEDEDVPAIAGVLRGEQIVEDTVIPQLRDIQDGSFDIDIDGATVSVTGLDFRTIGSAEDVRALIDTAIAGATVTFEDQRFIVTSDTTGVSSEASFLSAGATGTFVGTLLNLANGTGAEVTAGADAETIAAETKVEAVTAVKALVNFKGFVFASSTTDAESEALATWTMANGVMSYDVFDQASNLERDLSNPVWNITASSQRQYRMLYSKSGNRKLAVAYMSRMHTVNFNATNTALTMHLKDLFSVAGESYTQTEINKAKEVGLDIYTFFKNVPKVLTSGANGFADNEYNLLAFIDAVQTDTFNLLGTTPTKIAQTTIGINQIVDTVEKTCSLFVNANVFAPGTWSISDFFGNKELFDRNIESKGYYVLAESLANQVQSDRAARKSPPINVAVKNAGAVHSVDIIIRFNL